MEWETVDVPDEIETTLVRLKEVGQSVTGILRGTKEVKNGKFGDETHYVFTGKGADGSATEFAINPNKRLRQQLNLIKVGSVCCITRVEDKPATVEGYSPTHMFEVKRPKNGATGPMTAPPVQKPKVDPALDFLGV